MKSVSSKKRSTYFTTTGSPIGELLLAGDGDNLHALYMDTHRPVIDPRAGRSRDDGAFAPVLRQLEEYFAGERREFDLAIDAPGTPFRRDVWRALTEIPFGETRSYGQIAARVGNVKAARAVGMANNANPVAIIVPCHRVIGADGGLVGYGGGLDRKIWLLRHESGDSSVSRA